MSMRRKREMIGKLHRGQVSIYFGSGGLTSLWSEPFGETVCVLKVRFHPRSTSARDRGHPKHAQTGLEGAIETGATRRRCGETIWFRRPVPWYQRTASQLAEKPRRQKAL